MPAATEQGTKAISVAERLARAVLADEATAARIVPIGGEAVSLEALAFAVLEAAATNGISKCGSCQARIIWAMTANAKAMPIDAEPAEDGTFVFLVPGVVTHVSKATTTLARTADREGVALPRYKSHYASCPNADQHRKAR